MWHQRQGRMAINGQNDVYGDDVATSLLAKDLITATDHPQHPTTQVVALTDAGRSALETIDVRARIKARW